MSKSQISKMKELIEDDKKKAEEDTSSKIETLAQE